MAEETADDLLSLADVLADAVRLHALQLHGDPDDSVAVMSAVNGLAEAVKRYADACFTETRWGNPFAVRTEKEETTPEAPSKGKKSTIVTVEAKYCIGVRDMRAAKNLLARRGVSGDPCAPDVSDNPVDVVTALFLDDGWNPSTYDQSVIELIEEEWSCKPQQTPRTGK
ncbi:hypothetical protein [Streptomyces similanensis]|uniref:Uncharacterized protein n=1 Tax=Streptomyces similanensis TaxID=1274988 RepID=A0ABP9LP31_9ACTN